MILSSSNAVKERNSKTKAVDYFEGLQLGEAILSVLQEMIKL